MEQVIIFIESNTSGTGVLFFQKALELGYKPILLTKDSSFYKFDNDITTYTVDTGDTIKILSCLKKLQDIYEIKGIWSTSEYFIATVAVVAHVLGLPSANPIATIQSRNKLFQREELSNNGFSSPWYYKISCENELNIIADDLKFPCIIKPVDGTGSSGVKLCFSLQEIRETISYLTNRKINERGIKLEEYVLIEEYINGNEFSAEIFNGQVIGFIKKYLGELPYFVEIGHDFPFMFSENQQTYIKHTIEKIVKIFGLTFGPLHVEFRLKNEQVYIIEINPRLAGGYIPQLIYYSYGIDIIKSTLISVIGKDVQLFPISSLCSAIRFIIVENEGVFEGCSEKDDFKKESNLKEYLVYKDIGTIITVNNDFRDRIGHVIVTHKDYQTTVTIAEQLIKSLTLKIK